MDAFETILTRRSIRDFTSEKVSSENIEKILQAAMNAPSANNTQPWHFLVITDREILDKIPTAHPYAKMCLKAQVAIVPCVNYALYKDKDDFWMQQDMSAATQNILLAARALDLGAVWLGVYPNRANEIKKVLDLPGEIIPFCIIPIGHTKIKQGHVDRYKKDKVHYNRIETR